MATWGEDAVKMVELSAEQYGALMMRVVETAKSRYKEIGSLQEDDFLCGAMSAIEALGIGCPVWPLLIMTGRSVIDDGDTKTRKNRGHR